MKEHMMVAGKGRSWLVATLTALLVWVPGVAVVAQAPTKPQGSLVEQLTRETERARRQVETLYILRLSETLALNTDHSAQVAAVIRKAQETRRTLTDERGQIVRDLNALLAAGARAEQMKPKLSQWEQNEARLARWRQGLFQDLSRILSVEQQGRFLVFDENFNTEVRNAIMELRSSPRE